MLSMLDPRGHHVGWECRQRHRSLLGRPRLHGVLIEVVSSVECWYCLGWGDSLDWEIQLSGRVLVSHV